MIWITAQDLQDFASDQRAPGLLPGLLRRLVSATAGELSLLDFPSDESVRESGWDGRSHAAGQTLFVPAGDAGWECSCEAHPGGKATSDYKGRLTRPDGAVPTTTVFVAVTLRRWTGARIWAEERRAEGEWHDVRAYDANDLAAWLEQVPAVAAWLAEVIGKLPPGVQALENWWQGWSAVTNPPISKSLPGAGRDAGLATVHNWLSSSPGVLSVEGETEDEPVAFLVASIAGFPDLQQEAIWSSALVVTVSASLGQLAVPNTRMLLIVRGCDPVPADLATRHHVYRPLARNTTIGPSVLRLERPAPGAFRVGLQIMGLGPDRAERITRDSSRSLSVTRRLLSTVPLPNPAWATNPSGPLKAAMLAGAWDEAISGDREAIALLAGTLYENVQATLTQLSVQQEPPCRMIGTVWRVSSELTLWHALAPMLTRTDINRLSQVATQVLGAPDPGRELPPEKRWMANVMGKGRPHSGHLRHGLANRLIFLTALSSAAGVSAALNPEEHAKEVVRDLLHDAHRERWALIADRLPELAEAAPDEFLAAVEFSLGQPSPTIAELFVETPELFGSSSAHCGLLWAVERLAWEPAYLARVALALARLEQIDPGGSLANRPLRSLQNLFRPQMPQTAASIQQRAEALDTVVRLAPQSGWRVLLSFFDRSGFISPHPKPEYRSVPEPLPLTWNDVYAVTNPAWQRLVRIACGDGHKWVELLACFGQVSAEQRQCAITTLNSAEPVHCGRAELWAEVRSYISRNRRFSTNGWAVPEAELEQAERVYRLLEPEDSLERVGWLFENPWGVPLLNPPPADAFEATEIADNEARRVAVADLLAAGGITRVEALAELVKCPRLVGRALAEVHPGSELDSAIDRLLDSQETSKAELCAGAILSKFAGEGWVWAESRLEGAVRRGCNAEWLTRFLLCLPPCARTWKLVHAGSQEVAQKYWKRMGPYGTFTAGEADIMVNRLLEADRPIDALENAAWRRTHIEAATVARVLEALPTQLSKQQIPLNDSNALEISQLLDQLEQGGTADEVLAPLEFRYAQIFTHLKRPTSALHRLLARNPVDFVELVTWKDGTDDGVAPARARSAGEVLKSWHEIPGACLDSLENWVMGARSAAASRGYGPQVDAEIGGILARCFGIDADSGPPEQVSNAIESAWSQELDRGFAIGLMNCHGGPHQRDIESGGAREREIADRYSRTADRLRNRHPRVASILDRVAKSFAHDGRREDDRTELLLGF